MTTLNKKYYVYALKNPVSNEIFYVGVTIDPVRRLRDHASGNGGTGGIRKKEYINGIGFTPVMKILKVCKSEYESMVFETIFVKKYRSLGADLLNSKITYGEEAKKPMTFTALPSVVNKAIEKAKKEGKSLSQAVEDLLYDYSAE